MLTNRKKIIALYFLAFFVSFLLRAGCASSAPAIPVPGQNSAQPALQAPLALTASAQNMIPSVIKEENLPLTPYLDALLDTTASMDVDEVALKENSDKFKPFSLRKQAKESGVLWLRFILQPGEGNTTPRTYLLDMGDSVPGMPVLYTPSTSDTGGLEWKETQAGHRGILLLPEPTKTPITCYLRLDGLPGTWFAPVIRTPADAATSFSNLYRTAGILCLSVILLVTLLRGMVEQGQWRFWSFLYLCAALLQTWFGQPALIKGLDTSTAISLAAPGAALMFLPLAGAHLMRCGETSRLLNLQFFLLGFVGLVVSILPFLPSYQWTSRYAEFWPLGMLIFLPSTLGACLSGLPGSFRFLLGCLIPPAGVATGVLGLKSGFPPSLLAALPVWGTAFGALIIMGLPQPSYEGITSKGGRKKGMPVPTGNMSDELSLKSSSTELSFDTKSPASSAKPHFDLSTDSQKNKSQSAVPTSAPLSTSIQSISSQAELLTSVHTLLNTVKNLSSTELPDTAKEKITSLTTSAKKIEDILRGKPKTENSVPENSAFDLQQILLSVHNSAQKNADETGTALSWYMPPDIEQYYQGCGAALQNVLSLLLDEILQQAGNNSVRCSVKRVPSAANNGELLFTITARSKKPYTITVSPLVLSKARLLATASNGYLGLEYRPNETTISFTLKIIPVVSMPGTAKSEHEASPANTATGSQMQALLLADNPNIAVQILGLLKEAHCTVREAESIDELLALQRALPAGMLVLQGRAATPSAADTIAQIRKDCHSKQIPLPLILAYTSDESTWRSLAKAGFTHALSLPVERNSFLGTVKDALEMMEQHRNSSHPVELTQSMKVEEKIPDLFGPSSSQTVIQNSGLNIDLSPSLAEPSSSVNTSGNRGTSFQQPSLAAGFQQQPFVQLTPAETLSRASEKAVQGLEKGNMEQVEAFAKNIEETANSLSLTALARIAGLVRQAAKAKDTSAVQDLLPELSSVVERKIKELNLSL